MDIAQRLKGVHCTSILFLVVDLGFELNLNSIHDPNIHPAIQAIMPSIQVPYEREPWDHRSDPEEGEEIEEMQVDEQSVEEPESTPEPEPEDPAPEHEEEEDDEVHIVMPTPDGLVLPPVPPNSASSVPAAFAMDVGMPAESPSAQSTTSDCSTTTKSDGSATLPPPTTGFGDRLAQRRGVPGLVLSDKSNTLHQHTHTRASLSLGNGKDFLKLTTPAEVVEHEMEAQQEKEQPVWRVLGGGVTLNSLRAQKKRGTVKPGASSEYSFDY